MEFLLCVLGTVLVIEGIPYFGFPEQMKRMMTYIQQQDDGTLRMLGGIMMAIGCAIVFLARRGIGY
jgi:uncharacterized protein YjeT (DUF2065 family)